MNQEFLYIYEKFKRVYACVIKLYKMSKVKCLIFKGCDKYQSSSSLTVFMQIWVWIEIYSLVMDITRILQAYLYEEFLLSIDPTLLISAET